MADQEYDWADVERRLREDAARKGVSYDSSDLEGIRRNISYTDAVGNPTGMSFDQAFANQQNIYSQRQGNTPGGGQQQQSVTQSWSAPAAPTPDPAAAEAKQRSDALYQTLLERANQGLAVDRNSPVIRAQADAFSANTERASRNHLADLAEKSGPYANLHGEQRLAAERVGQQTGAFEAELMGRELTARREEIAQALASMGSMLSADQTRALQRELTLLDNAIRQQSLALQGRSLDQDWQRALMQNDQFLRQLGLQAWDRENYWDLANRGF